MFINVYHVFVSCYEFLKREREPFRFHSIIEFCSSTEMHKNLDDKYSPTIDVSIWFIWRWYVAKAINKYKCPFVCEEKVTVEQGLESVRIFLKDKYLLDKEDAPLKIAFKELQSIIDPEAILAENFRRSWKPLDLFKRGLQWFFSNFKKTKTLAELDLIQPKHDINFEHTEIWKFWLACIEKAKKFNVTFKYNKKKISVKQCFMACYEYVKMDSLYDELKINQDCTWAASDLLSLTNMENGTELFPTKDIAYWYDWMDLVQEVIEKHDVKFATDSEEGLSLEQGLEAMRIFVEKYYYNKNNDILLIDVLKNMDQQINNNLETTEMWKYWIECFKEAKKFDKIFYKESLVEVV